MKRKVAVVTGASKGIGRATAILLAKEGYSSVVLNFKSDSKAAQIVLEECNRYSKGNFLAQANVSKEDQVSQMFVMIKK